MDTNTLEHSRRRGNMLPLKASSPIGGRGFTTRALSVACVKEVEDWKVDLAPSPLFLAHFIWHTAHIIYSCLKTVCSTHTNTNTVHARSHSWRPNCSQMHVMAYRVNKSPYNVWLEYLVHVSSVYRWWHLQEPYQQLGRDREGWAGVYPNPVIGMCPCHLSK